MYAVALAKDGWGIENVERAGVVRRQPGTLPWLALPKESATELHRVPKVPSGKRSDREMTHPLPCIYARAAKAPPTRESVKRIGCNEVGKNGAIGVQHELRPIANEGPLCASCSGSRHHGKHGPPGSRRVCGPIDYVIEANIRGALDRAN